MGHRGDPVADRGGAGRRRTGADRAKPGCRRAGQLGTAAAGSSRPGRRCIRGPGWPLAPPYWASGRRRSRRGRTNWRRPTAAAIDPRLCAALDAARPALDRSDGSGRTQQLTPACVGRRLVLRRSRPAALGLLVDGEALVEALEALDRLRALREARSTAVHLLGEQRLHGQPGPLDRLGVELADLAVGDRGRHEIAHVVEGAVGVVVLRGPVEARPRRPRTSAGPGEVAGGLELLDAADPEHDVDPVAVGHATPPRPAAWSPTASTWPSWCQAVVGRADLVDALAQEGRDRRARGATARSTVGLAPGDVGADLDEVAGVAERGHQVAQLDGERPAARAW